MKRVQIKDIANQFNVAPSTVSRALNDMPGVGDDLKKKITDYAKKIGYQTPREVSRANTVKPNIIALIVGDITNPFYVDFISAFQKEASKQGYTVTVFSTHYDHKEEVTCIELVKRMNLAGVVQISTTFPSAITALNPHDTPIVTFYDPGDTFICDRILIDDVKSGYIAAKHLIDLGHKDIGFFVGHIESVTALNRYQGFKKAMEENHLAINENFIFNGYCNIESGYSLAKDMIQNSIHLPSAMIISNDYTAYGFITACNELGVIVPDKMSVVSFDNIKISYSGSTSITTVDTRAEEKGYLAAELVLNRIKRPNKKLQNIILDPVLIKRKSTTKYKK